MLFIYFCKNSRALHPESGRFIEVYSNQPGIRFSTGNYLPGREVLRVDLNNFRHKKDLKIRGKGGVLYKRHGGIGLIPQNDYNTENVKYLPTDILHPGKVYHHDLTFKFGVKT